jgi:hypothetical protein
MRDDGMRTLTIAALALALSACETMDAGTERVASFSADRINKYCDSSPAARSLVNAKVGPYLKPGNEVVCAGDKGLASYR